MTDDPRQQGSGDDLDEDQVEQSELNEDDTSQKGPGDTTTQGNVDRNP